MKALSCTAIASSVGAAITKEDILFILAVVVTIINLVIEYLKSRKDGKLGKD